jgi:hypothetical protein
MDPLSQMLMATAGTLPGPPPATLTQHVATVDAVQGSGAFGTGNYQGGTGSSTSQAGVRWGGFTGSKYFEWNVDNSWGNSTGMVGILNATHWNGGLSYGGSTGERAMMYLGNSFSYGEGTGTSQSGSPFTFTSGDICGCVWNEATGKLAFYKNGALGPVFTNTGFIGGTIYPALSYWTGALTGTLRSTPSAYAGSYVLPV